MRILSIITVLILLAFFDARAQYRINKIKYNSHDYAYQKGDRHHPAVCGVASYLLPGLGQIIAGEPGRGLLFTGAYAGSMTVFLVGSIQSFQANFLNPNPSNDGVALMIVGGTGSVVSMVWSIADAVKVAKINNLAYRDRRKATFQLEFIPYYATNTNEKSGQNFGASLKVKF